MLSTFTFTCNILPDTYPCTYFERRSQSLSVALAMRLSFNILNCTFYEVCKLITNTRVVINPEGQWLKVIITMLERAEAEIIEIGLEHNMRLDLVRRSFRICLIRIRH
mmetsp:Transcript_22275/g.33018  ORF Transcript_22275/g.33018 Transcript_22275/m.33018 type:complete len:108 (+) Transcript_22275:45-368(+)